MLVVVLYKDTGEIGIWKNLYNGFFSKTGMGFYPSPFTFLPGMPIKTGDLRMTGKI